MRIRIASETRMNRIHPPERRMEKLGKYLLRNEILSEAQLAEVVQAQVIFGGRLGTNVAELGFVNLDDLRRYLSEHLEIPAPNPEWIEQLSEEAHQSVSGELVGKYRVLPLKVDKRKLHLVMLDPRDPVQLDEIAFATGLTVVPYVLPEVELLALLEHHYGIRRETRYINLGDETARGDQAGPEPQSPSGETTPITCGDLDDYLVAPQAESEDLVDEDVFNAIHEREAAQGLPTAAVEPGGGQFSDEPTVTLEELDVPASGASRADSRDESIAHLEASLARARGRDAVGELALRIARRYSEAAALFIVRGGVVAGFRGDGDRVSEEISGILLAAEFDSLLTAPLTTRVAFRGMAPDDGIDAVILSSLGRGDVKEVAVFPILIRGEVVNLLYTDGGRDVLGKTSFAALDALATLVSHTYEQLIFEKESALR
jgi:hypothetical protein